MSLTSVMSVSPITVAESVPVAMSPTMSLPKKKRSVSFVPLLTVQPVERLPSTREAKLRLYYSTDELNAFSVEAKASRTLTNDVDSLSSSCSVNTMKRDCVVGLSPDPPLRGLELYLCPIRVRNKMLAQKALIKYHRNLFGDLAKTDDEKLTSLAAASAKLSRWSRMVAIETARLDSIRAYDVKDYIIPINERALVIEPFSATRISTKRRQFVDGDSQQDRSKMRCL